MRYLIVSAALFSIAGCSGSAALEKSEETQAAYALHGFVDQAMGYSGWMEQTATSPAVFVLHGDDTRGIATMTITKAGKCKYQEHLEQKGGPEDGMVLDMTRDLSGVDVDKAPPTKRGDLLMAVPGLVGTCTVSGSKTPVCDQLGDNKTPLFFGFTLSHAKDVLKAFTVKFCH